MITNSECIINYQAIEFNLAKVKQLAPKSKVLAIIKADAYGHGQLKVARHLDQADALAVVYVEQAKALRNAGIKQPIVLIYGVNDCKQMQMAIDIGCDLVIHHPYQLALLQQLPRHERMRIWLKIDTGMHRLGFEAEQTDYLIKQIKQSPGIKDIILMSHLATAEVPNCSHCQQQIQLFEQLTSQLPYEKSLLNSAGIIAYPKHQLDWVRPGLLLYGASPFADQTGAALGLQSSMHVRARITSIKTIKKGEKIGYGGVPIGSHDRMVATVGIGYAEGYPRHAQSNTPVLVRDTICHLIGRVSMNMLAIDISHCSHCQIGDWVTLWGEQLPIEMVAKHSNSITHEIMCRMGQSGPIQRNANDDNIDQNKLRYAT